MSFDAVRRSKKKSGGDEDGFMVCFSSLMILLLTFMILMVTLAQVKEPRFRKAIGSVKGAFAFLPHTGGNNPLEDGSAGFLPDELPGGLDSAEVDEMGAYELAVREMKRKAALPDLAGLEVEEREVGLVIRVSDALIFERGSAELKPDFLPILALVAETIRLKPGKVSVVGHTCDLPVATDDFPSNWELSVLRAVSVVDFLQKQGVEPGTLYAYGLADQQALAPNDREEDRRKNRRVEIYIAKPVPDPVPVVSNPGRYSDKLKGTGGRRAFETNSVQG